MGAKRNKVHLSDVLYVKIDAHGIELTEEVPNFYSTSISLGEEEIAALLGFLGRFYDREALRVAIDGGA